MNIPVRLTGTSPGVLNGGSLRFTNRKLRVKALPANLPDFVTADISRLKIGSKLLYHRYLMMIILLCTQIILLLFK